MSDDTSYTARARPSVRADGLGGVIEPFLGRRAWSGGRRGTDARVHLADETDPFTTRSPRSTGPRRTAPGPKEA
ncbi:hypothetical protein [Streptomyces sp. NPDC051109]|uniref:hypothetical protein n=1 Tax=Streptomyces sp. NPDC051109 TaxID=3365642 RepID=UPI00378CF4E4